MNRLEVTTPLLRDIDDPQDRGGSSAEDLEDLDAQDPEFLPSKTSNFPVMYPAIRPSFKPTVNPEKWTNIGDGVLKIDIAVRWDLMRYGQAQDGCREWFGRGRACKKHFGKTFQKIKNSCGRPACPECGDDWAQREAERATKRLKGCRRAYVEDGLCGVHMFDHIVFSPPEDEYPMIIDATKTREGYRWWRAEVRHFIMRIGMWGGSLIFHPWRFRHGDGSKCDGKARKRCTRKHYRYFSPHWHCIGIGYLTRSDRVWKATGWVYKKIQKRMTKRKIHNAVRYLLTHCGLAVDENDDVRCQTVTYFGAFANCKVRVIHRKRWHEERCARCREPIYEVTVNRRVDRPTVDDVTDWGDPIAYSEDIVTYKLVNPRCQCDITTDFG